MTDRPISIKVNLFACRCGIPVVIMGETGCGKTRLIRYMCKLARQGQKVKNFLILKVKCMRWLAVQFTRVVF